MALSASELAELREYVASLPEPESFSVSITVEDDGHVTVMVSKPGGDTALNYHRTSRPSNLLQAKQYIAQVVREALRAGGPR